MARVSREEVAWEREWSNGIKAVCPHKEAIYFSLNGRPLWVIHRFFRVQGTYREWRNLRISLQRRKVVDAPTILRLADHYGFVIQRARHIPKITGGERRESGDNKTI